jgi:hypothetical protein
VTLPNEEVMALLRERFVLADRNIEDELHVGISHGYACDQSAVGTTNGAGGRNVQILVLAADETVLHALPGFWHAEDLLPELRLALELHRLHGEDRIDEPRRLALFGSLHRAHMGRYGEAAARRGAWQDFDEHYEVMRAGSGGRDTVDSAVGGVVKLKPIPQLVHERLLARPFRPLREFGMEAFVDYGRPFYDNNHGDKGRDFRRAQLANEKRTREQQRARELAAKAAAKAPKPPKAPRTGAGKA